MHRWLPNKQITTNYSDSLLLVMVSTIYILSTVWGGLESSGGKTLCSIDNGIDKPGSNFGWDCWYSLCTREMVRSTWRQVFFYLLINIRSDLLARIKWFICILMSQRILCISFSRTDSGLCIYHLQARRKRKPVI